MNILKHIFIFLFFLIYTLHFSQSKEICQNLINQGISKMNDNKFSESLEILTKVENVAKKNKWYKEQFLALNNMGLNYYLMLDFGEALNHYLKAYDIAIKELESKEEMTVLNNIAVLYMKDQSYDKADYYFTRAYEIAQKIKNKKRIAMYAINIASVALERNDIPKAEKFLNIVFPLITTESELYPFAKITETKLLFSKKDYNKAQRNALQLLPSLQKPEFAEGRQNMLALLSEIALDQSNYEEAKKYALRSIYDKDINLELKAQSIQLLSDIFFKQRLYEQAIAYRDSLITVKDSVAKIKNLSLFENNKIKFEVQNYRKDLQDSQQALLEQRQNFVITIIAFLIFIIISVWATRNYLTKLKQRKIIAETQQKIIAL